MRMRLATPLLLAGLVTGLLTGCGRAPVNIVQSEATDGAAATSATDVASGSATDDGAQEVEAEDVDAFELAGKMRAAVLEKQTANVSTQSRDGGFESVGVVRYGRQPAMSMTLSSSSGQSSQVVMLGGVYYLNVGEPVNGKHWLKIDGKGGDRPSKSMAPLLSSMQQQSGLPEASTALKGVPATSAQGGELDGVATVAYTVKLNSKQLVASRPAESRKLFGSLLAGATGESTYYVDADWLPRKMVTVVTTQGKTTTSTMIFGKWGEPVTITAPPASDTTTRLQG